MAENHRAVGIDCPGANMRKACETIKPEEIPPNIIAEMQPTRPTEIARLQVAQLTIESGLSLTEVFQETSRITAETLNVARVGIWLMTDDQTSLQCTVLYERHLQSFGHGVLLQATDFPIYFEALRNRKIIPAEMAHLNPMTSELVESYFRPLDISSALGAPVLLASNVTCVLCCEHVGAAREWTTEERDFVESIANLLAVKMRGAEVHQLRELLMLSEECLATSEKSDVLAQMAIGVAHDLRNMLTVIQNCTEVMSLSEPSAVVQKNCSLISQTVARGAQFVRELAELGTSAPTQPIVLDVNEQIQAFMPIIRAATGRQHQIDLKIENQLGKLLIDRNHFERILLNLVMNAREALPHGGTIDIVARKLHLPGSLKHDRVAVEVRDHGCGMSEQTKKRIFEPFYTTKSAGIGLGMPIVARFVERAGGSIEIDSAPDVGTTIRLLFPLVARY